MKLSPVFHLKLQHCSNRPHNSAISLPLLHGNVTSASSMLFSSYYAVWNFAKLPSFPPDHWMHVHHVLPSFLFYSMNLFFWSERKLVTKIWVQIIRLHCNAMACSFLELEGGNTYDNDTEKLRKLQAYGGNPPEQHRMPPTFGHPELSIHPAGSPC